MLKPFPWFLICFSIWTVPWKQWIMACVLYFNMYFNSTFIQTSIMLVRSPSQALDRFHQPAVFFMFLRDFIVHNVLLSFCAVCVPHIEQVGMSSPKKTSPTFPGIVGWFAKSTNTAGFQPLLPFLFSSITVPMGFFQSQIDTFFFLSQPFLPWFLTFPFLCLCMITFFRIIKLLNVVIFSSTSTLILPYFMIVSISLPCTFPPSQ